MNFTGACRQKNTIIYQNQPEDTKNWTNLYLELHDYQIYYVNIDLCHQYGISVAQSRMFLCVKRPQRRRARRNGCFCRLFKRERGHLLGHLQYSTAMMFSSFILTYPHRHHLHHSAENLHPLHCPRYPLLELTEGGSCFLQV